MSATSDTNADPASPTAAPPELLVGADRAAELAAASLTWPSLTVDAATLADIELMLLGLFGPAPYFAEPGGVSWEAGAGMTWTDRGHTDAGPPGEGTMVPRLGVDPSVAEGLSANDHVALRDAEGVMVAALRVATVTPDAPAAPASASSSSTSSSTSSPTSSPSAGSGPGRVWLAGPVEGIGLPHHPDYPELRLTPRKLRAELTRRGWADGPDAGSTCALWADGLLHTADLDRIRSLRAQGRNVVVLAPVGGTDPADPAHHLRVRCLRAALAELAANTNTNTAGNTDSNTDSNSNDADGGDRGGPGVGLVLVPARPADPTALGEASMVRWRAHLAAGYGLAGSLLGPAPGAPEMPVLTEALDAGKPLPAELTPAAVAAELARAHPPRHLGGLTVLFTGLSGSGKSTLANLLTCRLLERGDRVVTLLDGDVVRHHLSAGLGFSRADRDTNIRRIGFVAAQAAGAGGTVVCAPIAPYASVRAEVRAMVERRGAGFVLVHVSTPLEVCEARDRKGLYAKARAGLLGSFTGVSDPYEVPTDADIVVDTSVLSADAAVDKVLHHLRSAGWLV